jgi:rare lipoprotein A (peptidoglycan hydrolase)
MTLFRTFAARFNAAIVIVGITTGLWAVGARAGDAEAAEPRVGIASWYGATHQGRKTASGEPFDMFALTAAHRSLPLGTLLGVKNLANGKRVTVRGPYVAGRIIDLSLAAARRLALVRRGIGRVRLSVIADGGRRGAVAVLP